MSSLDQKAHFFSLLLAKFYFYLYVFTLAFSATVNVGKVGLKGITLIQIKCIKAMTKSLIKVTVKTSISQTSEFSIYLLSTVGAIIFLLCSDLLASQLG